MQNKRLGCLSGTGILAGIVTVLLIAGYIYANGGLLYNPGPLNAQAGELIGGVTSHAATGGNCQACHVAPWSAGHMADRCADCHGTIAAQMQDVASLHGKMLHDNPELTCRHCHPEHRGPEALLTEIEGWRYPHEMSGFSLAAHQFRQGEETFVCADCQWRAINSEKLKVLRRYAAPVRPPGGSRRLPSR